MSDHNVDEETPLLAENGTKKMTPLPWSQFSIVLLLQLPEPLTSNVIFPFAPQMIRDIGVTHGNETKVGYYVGFIESIFFLTEAITVLHWGQLSDRIGRKPVILIGLFGLSLSMLCFGLSTTFWGLVISRSLSGALNGNAGVIKSTVVEMTDVTNIAKAYSYAPIVWVSGCILGPAIGGLLARPTETLPDIFGKNAFLQQYPYFLPCAVSALVSFIAWLVAFLFFKETLAAPITIRQLFSITKKKANPQNGNESTDTSVATQNENLEEVPEAERPLPLRSLLIPRVLIPAANLASLSFLDMAVRAIQPLFYSTPIHLGGLGVPLPLIGTLLSGQAVLGGLFQVLFFARIHNRFGSKKTFIAGIACSIFIFVMFPVANTIARSQGLGIAVWIVVLIQIIALVSVGLAWGAIFIFIAGAAPNRASLGATNGLCQMTASIMRAIGPATVNSLFSLSIEKGYLGGGLVYCVLIVLNGVALFLASRLPRQNPRS